jgi:hypothetical protein
MENNTTNANTIAINEEIKSYLLESAKWCKFLAILGYIGMGILTLVGLLMMVGLPFMSSSYESVPLFGLGLLYVLLAVVYYFPTLYLYRFAFRIKQGFYSNDESVLTDGFLNLKKSLRFVGIMIIILLSLYALILVIAIPTALFLNTH